MLKFKTIQVKELKLGDLILYGNPKEELFLDGVVLLLNFKTMKLVYYSAVYNDVVTVSIFNTEEFHILL